MRVLDGSKMDPELEDLKDVIRTARQAYRAAAEKPDSYWEKLQDAIVEKLSHPGPSMRFRFAYILPAVAVVVLLCLFLFMGTDKSPVPDIAAGYDQELLIEVERALNRDYPLALKPAVLLAREIEQEAQRE